MINKHEILREWVQNNFLTDRYLYFENVEMNPYTRTLVPNYGEYKIGSDITGALRKRYTFAFVGVEDISNDTNTQNTDNMLLFDQFNDWIVKQNKARNFPDFGESTSDYEMRPVQNMANLAMLSEDKTTAKYMLQFQIDYTEREV